MKEYQNNVLIQLGFICIFTLNANIVCGNSPIVNISNGTLHGKIMPTRLGRGLNAFLGIPYAAPPIGELRFKVKLFLFFYAELIDFILGLNSINLSSKFEKLLDVYILHLLRKRGVRNKKYFWNSQLIFVDIFLINLKIFFTSGNKYLIKLFQLINVPFKNLLVKYVYGFSIQMSIYQAFISIVNNCVWAN